MARVKKVKKAVKAVKTKKVVKVISTKPFTREVVLTRNYNGYALGKTSIGDCGQAEAGVHAMLGRTLAFGEKVALKIEAQSDGAVGLQRARVAARRALTTGKITAAELKVLSEHLDSR